MWYLYHPPSVIYIYIYIYIYRERERERERTDIIWCCKAAREAGSICKSRCLHGFTACDSESD